MEDQILIQTDNLELSQLDFLIRMLVAGGIGFVIGLEREHSALSETHRPFAGVRTFMFIVLLGFFSAFCSFLISPWVFLVTFGGLILLLTASYWLKAQRGDFGGTSEMATLIAFLLGGSTLMGYINISLALMVVVVLSLSLKVKLHAFIGRLSQEEVMAFIRFVVLALLILPFLPNKYYGPYNALNPYEIGVVIVLTSGIGFAGYMLMKFLGSNRGILLTGIVGGFVSSTVVTWVFSKKSKETPALSANCAVAILAAASIMVIRVFVWLYIFNRSLIGGLLLPLLLLLGVGILVAWRWYRRQGTDQPLESDLPLGNPLNLRDAIFFGLLYAGILLLVNFANATLGAGGIYLSSGIAALTDIDAITISMAKLGGDSIPALVAQNAILIACLANTIIKIGIALWFGSSKLRRYIILGYGLMFGAGVVGFLLLNLGNN